MSGRWAVAAALAASSLSSGCVTLSRTVQGSMPPPAAIAGLQKGAPLQEVLTACGAPFEVWRQPDGLLLLIYRAQFYRYDSFGIGAYGISYLPLSDVLTSALSNLRLIYGRGTVLQDRLAVLLDRDNRVVAVSYRSREAQRLVQP